MIIINISKILTKNFTKVYNKLTQLFCVAQ